MYKKQENFKTNNNTIVLMFSFQQSIVRQSCILKQHLKRENEIISLMITARGKWPYLDVKSLSRLLQGITLKHNEFNSCINCLHSFRTEWKILQMLTKIYKKSLGRFRNAKLRRLSCIQVQTARLLLINSYSYSAYILLAPRLLGSTEFTKSR